jgi:hypothetical protein
MFKDSPDKAAEGQQKSDGDPGHGAIEWTGEPLPPDVIEAAAASAATIAAAAGTTPTAEPPRQIGRPGVSAIGGTRPWAATVADWPDRPSSTSHRRLITTGGVAVIVVALIASAAFSSLSGGGTATPSAPAATNESVALAGDATATANPSATPSDTATPQLSASPTAGATPSQIPGSPPGPVEVSTPVDANRGLVVSTDNFGNAKSGWSTSKSSNSVTTFGYVSGGYQIGSRTETLEHMAYAPYRTPKLQLSMSVTASQAGAPKNAGFGVTCRRGSGSAQTSYVLKILNSGSYYIERYEGTLSATSNATTVGKGHSPTIPGTTPTTIVGMCSDLGGGATRLTLFVNGTKIADVADSTFLSGSGWTGGIVMSSGKTPSVLTVTAWQERDLAK